MSSGSPGRQSHWQHTHYLRKSFTYQTLGAEETGVLWVGALPPGAILRGAMLKVHTVFDSTTSDIIDVGTTVDPDNIIDAADLTVAGGQYSITPLDFPEPTEATDVWIRWTPGTTATATQGRATVIVEYFPNNDL
jgi:hypothetical protein